MVISVNYALSQVTGHKHRSTHLLDALSVYTGTFKQTRSWLTTACSVSFWFFFTFATTAFEISSFKFVHGTFNSFAELIVIADVFWKTWLFIQHVEMLSWLLGSLPSDVKYGFFAQVSISLPFCHFYSAVPRWMHHPHVPLLKRYWFPTFAFFPPHYIDSRADTPIFYKWRLVVSFLSYTF